VRRWRFISGLSIVVRGRWGGIFKWLSQDKGRADFPKNLHPLSLIKAFPMNLISAGSISLDNIFKTGKGN
jgi:hypothetical protein